MTSSGWGSRCLLGRLALRFAEELLGELPLAGGVELLELVVEHALVDRLVPVVEALEAQQRRLADELPQDFVGRSFHPAGTAAAQVAIDAEARLVAAVAAGIWLDIKGTVGSDRRVELTGEGIRIDNGETFRSDIMESSKATSSTARTAAPSATAGSS